MNGLDGTANRSESILRLLGLSSRAMKVTGVGEENPVEEAVDIKPLGIVEGLVADRKVLPNIRHCHPTNFLILEEGEIYGRQCFRNVD